MALVLERQADTRIPVDVRGIVPNELLGMSNQQISKQQVWLGRRQLELGELFRVSGKIGDAQTIRWIGHLEAVHWIGADMNSGRIEIISNTGRHVGSRMAGGVIAAAADVSDFAGAEMTGGTIRVNGNAGDHVGGNYSGSNRGMNRGEILISGDAGRGCGQAMRRGSIVVGGNVDRLCGWNMLAGSIIVLGRCGPECGAGMIRGTIILAGDASDSNHCGTGELLMPTFAKGGQYDQYLLGLTARWLQRLDFGHGDQILHREFQMYHGDLLRGGRGEIFVGL